MEIQEFYHSHLTFYDSEIPHGTQQPIKPQKMLCAFRHPWLR